MSRLTKYDEKQKQYIRLASRLAVDNKLGKLEDLEEQLGCQLDVIEKAIKNGIYTNVYSGICYVTRSDDYLLVSYDYDVKLSDYKKTWWLKEDKSE